MKFKTSFTIEGLPKTYNNSKNVHWAIKGAEARTWKSRVRAALRDIPSVPFQKASLTLTRVSSICPDPDNLVQTFKHVIDGLVDAGVIENDKFVNIGMPNYLWEKGKKNEGYIKVEIESDI